MDKEYSKHKYTPAGLIVKSIYYWIDRNKTGGFDKNLTYTENLDALIEEYKKLILKFKSKENDKKIIEDLKKEELDE